MGQAQTSNDGGAVVVAPICRGSGVRTPLDHAEGTGGPRKRIAIGIGKAVVRAPSCRSHEGVDVAREVGRLLVRRSSSRCARPGGSTGQQQQAGKPTTEQWRESLHVVFLLS